MSQVTSEDNLAQDMQETMPQYLAFNCTLKIIIQVPNE